MSDQTPQIKETVILPLSVADTQQLPLITDTQYLEIASSTSMNRKFFGIARAGIYRGFACIPDQGLNVKIKNTQSQNGKAVDFGVALIERDDFLLTVRQQHDITLPVPAGATSYVVLEAFYKHGVKTKQVSKDATVDAASVKVLSKGDVKPHHLILAKVVVPDGATSLQAANFHYEDRKAGGYDLDAHKDELDPHEQYEREDNAANNAEIDAKSTAVKHVKLSQLWRAINNLKAEHNPFPKYWHNDETATQADAEAGSTNNKIMTALRTQQWWEKAKTKAQTVTAAWTFTGAFKVKSADEANSNVDIEGHRPDNTGIIGALRFLNRSDGKSFSLTSDGNGLLKWANHKVFHEGNRNITSAINNPSEIIYASAKGVKTAFDKGVEAINLANTKVAKTSISDAINSASQTTVGSSKAVKIAFDKAVEAINLANTKVAKASISDSVTSASKTTVGSSKAIKTAFDKAVDAINLANTKVAKTQVSDSVTSDSQTNVASSKAAKTAHNKGVEALNKANTMIPKAVISDSVTSDSQTNVGSSKAVKTANDRANQAYNLASTKVAKADISDSVTSDSSEDIASSKAAKTAHDKGVEALNKANAMVPKSTISESVTSSSNTTVASSKAVKTAHDKGVTALNTANKKVDKSAISDSVTSSSSSTVGSSKAVKAAFDKAFQALSKAESKWSYRVASLSEFGATKLSSAINSTSETLAATPKAVKAAYDLAASKITKAQADSYYLAKNAKADNASKLDGLSASQLVRSDADDVVTGNTQWANGHAPYLKDNANGGRIPAPAGGFLYNGASSATGAIKIKLPVKTKGQSDMLSFEVSIFDYAHNESVKLLIAGYQYGTKDWTNQTVITLTNSAGKDYRVRFGNDGTSHCLWIGETNSTWNHLQIGVFNVLVGYSADATKYADGWSVSLVTKYDTIQDTVSTSLPAAQTANKLQNARSIILGGDVAGSATFDGTANSTINVTVKDDSHNHVIGNIDGLSTELNNIKKAIDTKLATTGKAADANLLDGINSTGFARAYSGAIGTGGGDWTTTEFVSWLKTKGAMTYPYWVARGSWSYAGNKKITDTGVGTILLAGCTIEVIGNASNYTIRILCPSTSSGGDTNTEYVYCYNGKDYAPTWRRVYSTHDKPTKADVGLSALVNAPQTSAINDSSTTTYATAKGVKTAYDRGTEALNAANTKVAKSSISNSVSSTSTTTVASSKAVRDTYNRAVAAENNAKNHTNTEISKLLGGATQQDLDTIRELGEALKDNDSDIGAINTELGKKANKTTKVSVSGPLTGGGDLSANRVIGIKDATTGQKGAVQLTDSVGSTSQVLAATARAVKTAHDKGLEALNKANSKWTYVVASKTAYGATKLLTAVNSTSETLAATPKAVKMAYDLAASKITKAQGDGWWLGKAAKAADSNKLDGLDSSQFLRSDADDNFSGSIISTNRSKGVIGVYDSHKTDQIWSMGAAYKNAADGKDFGNLYGFAYKHTNNKTGGTMAGGHQAVWTANGSPKAAIGESGLWGLAVYDGSGSNRQRVYSPNNRNITDAIDNASSTIYASARAVKAAYDLAKTKITKGQGDSWWLGKTAKAADSNKLDGLDSTQFVRSDADDTLSGSFLWSGDQDYDGLYWGSRYKDSAAHAASWAYIRQGTTAGQLEIGSDDLVNFYETDSRALAVSISTNNKTLDAKGGLLEGGTKLQDKYLSKTAKAADSDKLDGQDSKFYLQGANACYKDITVGGDANKYYPVFIGGAGSFAFNMYSISRGYSWTAPTTWNNATHKGGLTLTWMASGDSAWGGNDHTVRVVQFDENYSTMVAGMTLTASGMIVYLRGGGAKYRVHTPAGQLANVAVHLNGYTSADKTVHGVRSDVSKTAAEVTAKMFVRGVASLYDNNQRVFSPNNRNISEAINSSNTSVYASSKAVKTAYDKGVEALNKGNSAYNLASAALPKNGGTMKGNITFVDNNEGIFWTRNTDGAFIKFKNDSDADTNSYLEFGTIDNGNEFFKWTIDGIEEATLKRDGLRVANNIYEAGQRVFSPNNRNITDAVNNASSTIYASAKAVKAAYDLAASKITKAQGDGWWLGKTAKAADSNKLDGLDSSQFMRSDADDAITGNTQWASGHAPYLKDNANGGRIPAPAGAYLYNGASSATGAIKIKLPTITKGQSDMLSFEVSIFDYAANESVKLLIAGYQYSSKDWTNQTVVTLTNSAGKDYRVRFGNDGTSHCLWIGETNSTWNHLQIGVFNVLVGYSADATKYAAGWTVSIVTKYDTVQDTVSASLPAAQTATKLQSARTIALAGDATGSTTFDGTGNKTITVTVKDDSHNHVIGNVDGLQAALDGKLPKGSKAVDSAKLNGVSETTGPTANRIVKRDGSGDVQARLVRTTYGNQTSAPSSSAAIVFRNNNSSDNYHRTMTKAAMKAWLTLAKSDVGLGSVVNAPQTSAVNDASTTKYATAKGVKTAYDKAVSAYNLANGKMTQATGDGRYLGKTAKAADANKLDGKDSTAFVQTSGNQTVAGKKTFNDEIGLTSKAGIKFDAATESINFVFH